MSDKDKKALENLKKAVPHEKGDTFEVKKPELTDQELEAVSGGLEIAPDGDLCMCKCGSGATCGGGGGG